MRFIHTSEMWMKERIEEGMILILYQISHLVMDGYVCKTNYKNTCLEDWG